ncbi:MAG: VanZ family protein [candidate division Zixibacteria bacterium]|nr:VanZ family protein [candidate division Zixibacteria bacterium]
MLRRFLLYHLPALAYAALIIGLSSLRDVRLPRVQFLAIDKVAHFMEYVIFAWLVFRSARHIHPAVNTDDAAFLTLGFVTVFAFGDEFYQGYIPGRQSDPFDFLTDVAAGLAAVVAIRFLRQHTRKITA